MTALMLQSGETPDGVLVARARDGDRSAFGDLVSRHYDFVYRIAYRWCANRADAEDIAQEVCARLGRAIRDYRGGGAFTTWLYTLTLNAVRDMKRKSARESAKLGAFGEQARLAGDGDSRAEAATQELWEAVRALPDKQRDAVLLVYGEGLGHAAAAEVMGISETTVSWHVHEAKKRLKTLMRSAREV